MEKSGKEKTNKNKNKTSARHRNGTLALVRAAETGRHTLPGCGERPLCSAQRLAEVRRALQPP